MQREDVPEVAVEEPGEPDVPTVAVPESGDGFSVVAFPRVHSVLLGPQVDHVSGHVHEGVRKHCPEVARQAGAEHLHWHHGVVGGPPDDGEFVDEPVVAEEAREGQQGVLYEEWQGVAEQVVGSLLEGDSAERVEVAGVPLLQVLGEGAVSVVGSEGHVSCDGEGRSDEEGAEESGELPVNAVFEASEVALPTRVELPDCGDFEPNVEEGSKQCELPGIAHALVEGLETGDGAVPGPVLGGVDWRLVVLGEELGAVDEVADVLLEVCGDESDHYAFVRTELPR